MGRAGAHYLVLTIVVCMIYSPPVWLSWIFIVLHCRKRNYPSDRDFTKDETVSAFSILGSVSHFPHRKHRSDNCVPDFFHDSIPPKIS